MTKRITNKELIRAWIKINGKGALERLAFESGCSASLIQKLCSDTYDKVPLLEKIDGICRVTGHEINELFPVVENKKEPKAS